MTKAEKYYAQLTAKVDRLQTLVDSAASTDATKLAKQDADMVDFIHNTARILINDLNEIIEEAEACHD